MDLRTLFFVEASLLFLFGLTMIVNSIGHPSHKGNYWFAASNFCGGVGLLLHSSDPHASRMISMVLADLLLFVELTFLNKAIAEFVGKGRNVWLYLLGLSVLMTYGVAYFAILHPDMIFRIGVISVITISTAVCSSVLVFRSITAKTRMPTLLMGALLVTYASTNIIRMMTVWLQPRDSFYHIWLDRTLIAGLSFGYLWMTAARLRNDLERLAGTDALTGTLNRRAIEREVQFAVDRSRENHGSVSALMLDVDYFKQINDNYGHHAGDLALCAIAECLRRTIRAGDLLARLGGDEFLVVMPNSTAEIAQIAANRIQAQLATLRVVSDNAEFGLQASIGVTTLDSQNLQLDDLMQFGDRALYEVKARNRRPPSTSQPLVLSPRPQVSM